MDQYKQYNWQPHERPLLPGSPSTPNHTPLKRVIYLIVGIIVSITGGLGNAIVTVNVNNLQGTLGATAVEIAWLPAAYMMTNISINLLLVKVRQQFGLRVFAEPFIILYALITLAHLFANDYVSAIAVRAASGIAGAALSTLSLLYILQGFPQKIRLNGLVIAVGLSLLSIPLARLFTSNLLDIGEWRGLYVFELGLALISLACVLWLKLPPSDRVRVFEKLDFFTFALFASGMALLVAVLSLGRIVWWFEAPWIGVCLALSVALISAALIIEHNRKNPLIDTRWLSGGRIARVFTMIVLVRVIATEQTTGAVGFMQIFGLNNDQLDHLFHWVLAGSLLGIFLSALTLNPKHLVPPVLIAVGIMGAGALMDATATNLTRPEDLYVSQFLIAFGVAFFLGPAIIIIISDVVTNPKVVVSFSAMFGMSQNLGSLIGAALVGTFQTAREKYYSSYLTENLNLMNPQVVTRVQQQAAPYSKALTDPALLQAQGLNGLKAAATREANVLAYNDTFLLIFFIAVVTFLWILYRIIRIYHLEHRQKLALREMPSNAVSQTGEDNG